VFETHDLIVGGNKLDLELQSAPLPLPSRCIGFVAAPPRTELGAALGGPPDAVGPRQRPRARPLGRPEAPPRTARTGWAPRSGA
jgi:hypothetical protein